MYSTCLFCNSSLGQNEAIEEFPVGRRLAFDAAKGRLWVICQQCERWNLTPLEERWEAIESCERAFRDTRLRVSTDEIGMARLREGLELVRIGAPQLPEMAAWRYGDQFGRRQRRAYLIGGALAVATGGYLIAGPMLGLIGGGGMGLVNIVNGGRAVYRTRSIAARIPVQRGESLVVQKDQLDAAQLLWDPTVSRWSLDIAHRQLHNPPWWHYHRQRATTTLAGDDAVRAARLLLPGVNASGAGKRAVNEAVTYLEESPAPDLLFGRTARSFAKKAKWADQQLKIPLKTIPKAVRLALEMSANEETERRALEGELHLLESAWRDAEEIAGIADDMFLPASIDDELKRLKERNEG